MTKVRDSSPLSNSYVHSRLMPRNNKRVSTPIGNRYYYNNSFEWIAAQPRVTRYFLDLLYEHKESLKKHPIIWRTLSKAKRKVLSQPMEYSPGMKSYQEHDVDYLALFEGKEFILELYRGLLNRDPDPSGYESVKDHLASGVPRKAIIFSVIKSKEFANRFQIRDVGKYRLIYFASQLIKLIKAMPIIGSIYLGFKLPRSVEALKRDEYKRYFDLIEVIYQMKDALSEKSRYQSSLMDRLGEIQAQIVEQGNYLHKLDRAFTEQIKEISETNKSISGMGAKLINHYRPSYYSGASEVIIVQSSEFILAVPSIEWRLAAYIQKFDAFEPGSEKYFKTLLKAGMTVLDVGANLGIYSLHALKAGCRVIAFEPAPQICDLLTQNIQVNGFEPDHRFTLECMAVTDREGTIEFGLNKHISGHSSIYSAGAGINIINVKTTDIDTYMSGNKVDIVKIDTEGAEILVLLGMRETILNNPDIKIMIEFAPSNLLAAGYTIDEFFSTIRALDLGILAINEVTGTASLMDGDSLDDIFSQNLLLFKQGRMP